MLCLDHACVDCTTGTERLIHKLTRLPLKPQDQFVLLSGSLQHRDVHLMRGVPWAQAGTGLQRLENLLVQGFRDIAGISTLSEPQHIQLTLPHRHGGFALFHASQDVAGAAYLAAASLAHACLQGGHLGLRPFDGPSAPALLSLWDALCARPPELHLRHEDYGEPVTTDLLISRPSSAAPLMPWRPPATTASLRAFTLRRELLLCRTATVPSAVWPASAAVQVHPLLRGCQPSQCRPRASRGRDGRFAPGFAWGSPSCPQKTMARTSAHAARR